VRWILVRERVAWLGARLSRRPLVYYVFPLLLWMGLIYALSAQPSLPKAPGPLIDLLLKKGAHMAGYAVLMVLWWRALANYMCVREPRVRGPRTRGSQTDNTCADRARDGPISAKQPHQLVVLVIAWAATVSYAVSDEVHQTFVPGRSGRALDVLIDACGALLVGIVLWTSRRSR
jgi:VanZ family protein